VKITKEKILEFGKKIAVSKAAEVI